MGRKKGYKMLKTKIFSEIDFRSENLSNENGKIKVENSMNIFLTNNSLIKIIKINISTELIKNKFVPDITRYTSILIYDE